MKQLILLLALIIMASSCESTAVAPTKQSATNSIQEDATYQEEDTLVPVAHRQTSDGLEHAVVQYYKDEYEKGELRSIRRGMSQKMDPSSMTVYLDTNLYGNNSLGFYFGKYPEFIVQPLNPAKEGSIRKFETVNCKAFKDINAMDFLSKVGDFKEGDLLLAIGQAFYQDGAHYVHTWNFSRSKDLFHYEKCTFKFDASNEIIDRTCTNVHQIRYGGARAYLLEMDLKVTD